MNEVLREVSDDEGADEELIGPVRDEEAPRDWRSVTGRRVAIEDERRASEGRTLFDDNNPRPGPQRVWSSNDPYDFLKSMFTDSVIDLMVTETNRYADQIHSASEMAPHARLRDFKPTNRAEMETYLGIQVSMGLIKKPQITDYWSTNKNNLGWTPNYSRTMSRNRFQMITACLHFNNNRERVERDQPGYNPLFKVRPLLDQVSSNFSSEYYPHEQLSIDESMVSFRGRIFFRQYIPSKRHWFGIKNFVLTDASTNYTYIWDVYTGGAYTFNRETGIGHSTVMTLMNHGNLLGKGHTVYTDNLYTSPALYKALHAQNTGACGTVRVNRRGMPPGLRNLKLKPTEPPVFFESFPLLAASFRDAGIVTVLSTVNDNAVISKGVRSKGPDGHRVLKKPKAVDDYYRYMGGVDRADQLCSYYAYQHRVMKWYHRLYHHIKEVALVNAYILYKESASSCLPGQSCGGSAEETTSHPITPTDATGGNDSCASASCGTTLSESAKEIEARLSCMLVQKTRPRRWKEREKADTLLLQDIPRPSSTLPH
ncbi:hypothetical protein SKAU_G00236210 [Synaphobranchus kaupii]|uniref:PiggyBac transposable element-derived protein domain-containing protein n=1 Tax=Synaphobranchus kaupii TaxID=118154 RepID=A0A9Q1F6R4_SYNKA|nr:hypothetical protein SKAU_G00236210 [Synaphobranchus kaupii]